MVILAGADVVQTTEGRMMATKCHRAPDPAGDGEQGRSTRVPQEPGSPLRLRGRSRPEIPGDQLQARGRRTRRPRERNPGAAVVPPNEVAIEIEVGMPQ